MKIGNADGKGPVAPASGTRPSKIDTETPTPGAGEAAPAAGKEASAKVQLSDAASGLLSGAGSADFDAAKVERLSKSIADGSFKVNHEAIADKLIANAQELLGRVSH